MSRQRTAWEWHELLMDLYRRHEEADQRAASDWSLDIDTGAKATAERTRHRIRLCVERMKEAR